MEFLFDKPHFPQIIGSSNILKIVSAVNVDKFEFIVFGRVALYGEPLVKHQVVPFRFAGELAPDDERSAAVGCNAGHGAEPVRAVFLKLEAAVEAQALLVIALEHCVESLRGGNVPDREANQPVECLK